MREKYRNNLKKYNFFYKDIMKITNILENTGHRLTIGEDAEDFKYKYTNENHTHLSIKFESISKLIKYDYDVITLYETYPNKFEENQYNIKEQMRLKRNIEKLRALEYLNTGGYMFYYLTHLFNQSTQDIVLILSYLFDECRLIKSIFTINNTQLYVYAEGFNKSRYSQIKDEIDIKKFEKNGDISRLSSLGINCINKEISYDSINEYNNKLYDILNLAYKMNVKDNDLLKIVPKLLYNIRIAIKPKYLDKKFEKYEPLYNICSDNKILRIYIDVDVSEIIELIDIYINNNKRNVISVNDDINTYNNINSYDLMILNTYSNIVDKLEINKFVYIVDKKINDDRFIKIDVNIYQKIKN